MKFDNTVAGFFGAILLASLAPLATVSGTPSTDLEFPVGTLSASTTVARAGTFPTLDWKIQYPSTVTKYVEIEDGSTIVPKEKLKMSVRVLGAGVTASNSNSNYFEFVHTEGYMSYNGSSWSRVFRGTNWDVSPDELVASRTVKSNKEIRFGGRFYYNRSWSDFRYSNDGTVNVRTLVNGETPPTTYPLHNSPTLESFLKPYLDASGRVAIGPMDVIVFMELTHNENEMDDPGYDLQDLVFLVTFETIDDDDD